MKHLEGSGTPVLYVGRTVLKSYGSGGRLQSSSVYVTAKYNL